MSNSGFNADPAARQFVVAARPELGGSSIPTPPVLVFNAEGQVLAEVSNYAPTAEILDTLLSVLAQYPEYDQPLPGEVDDTDAIAQAQIAIDRHDYGTARLWLDTVDNNMSRYLRGRLDRFDGNWPQMAAGLGAVDHPDLELQIRMERAYQPWYEQRYADVEAALYDFPQDSDRYTEARYYLGLALYKQGRTQEATAVWADTIERQALIRETPWLFRADWAHYDVTGVTLLGRTNGYLGNENPELAGPVPW